jgi:hypothetical protein
MCLMQCKQKWQRKPLACDEYATIYSQSRGNFHLFFPRQIDMAPSLSVSLSLSLSVGLTNWCGSDLPVWEISLQMAHYVAFWTQQIPLTFSPFRSPLSLSWFRKGCLFIIIIIIFFKKIIIIILLISFIT